MLRCRDCGKQFVAGSRLDDVSLWEAYVRGQNVSALAAEHSVSSRTIRRRIARVADRFVPCFPQETVLIIDTTYWGRCFGAMLFQDAWTGRVLHRIYVTSETNKLYLSGISYLKEHGVHIKAVVCDGHPGLIKSMKGLPVQMCQFHMYQIVLRKTTSRPRLDCGKELLALVGSMFHMSRKDFETDFERWQTRWKDFLAERTKLPDGSSAYTHRRLRSAVMSLITYLPYLFVHCDFPKMEIPNTTNKLEGLNAQLKNAVRKHSGLNETNRKKLIDALLSTFNEKRK